MKCLPKCTIAAVITVLLLTAGCPGIDTIPVVGVSLNVPNASIPVSGTVLLVATIYPSNATNQDVTWDSSSGFLCPVYADGAVYGDSATVSTITVTTVDGGFTAECIVTVY